MMMNKKRYGFLDQTLSLIAALLIMNVNTMITSLGKNSFVHYSPSTINLINSKDEVINTLNESINFPIKYAVSNSPLSYSLFVESDDTLSAVKWDANNNYSIFRNVNIGKRTLFSSMTCLSTSTLCYASSIDNYFLRFDIRLFEQNSLSPQTLVIFHTRLYSKIEITDSNLKYMFAISGNTVYYIDPKDLFDVSRIDINNAHSQTPKLLSTFQSSSLVVIASNSNKLYNYKINSSNSYFEYQGFGIIMEITTIMAMKTVQGTRYIMISGDSNSIYFLWSPYNNHINDSDHQTEIISNSAPEISSFDFLKTSLTSIQIKAVDNNNPGLIHSKDINLDALNYLKNSSNKNLQGSCDPTNEYAKNRCTGCRYGRIIEYTFTGMTLNSTDCLELKSGIRDFRLEKNRFRNIDSCFQNPLKCDRCTLNMECSTCQGDLLLKDGYCIEKCRFGKVLKQDICVLSCGTDHYVNNYECYQCNKSCLTCYGPSSSQCLSCQPPFILGPSNSCVTECPQGYIKNDATNTCDWCSFEQVWSNFECTSSCPRGTTSIGSLRICKVCAQPMVVIKGICTECPDGTTYDINDKKCISIIDSIRVVSQIFQSQNSKLYLTFSQKIKLINLENSLDIALGNKIHHPLSIKIIQGIHLVFTLDIKETIQDANLVIRRNQQAKINQFRIFNPKTGRVFKKFPIQHQISKVVDQLSPIMKVYTTVFSWIQLFLSFLLIIIEPATLILFMRLLQSLKFLSLVNIEVPPIVLDILVNLNINFYKFLSKIIGELKIDDEKYDCNLHPKLLENDVSCISLNMIGVYLCYFGLFFVVKVTFLLIELLISSKKSRVSPKKTKNDQKKKYKKLIRRSISYINTKLDIVFYYWFFKSMEIDLFLGSWATLKSSSVVTIWSILSNSALPFFIAHSLLYSFMIIRLFFSFYLPREEGIFNTHQIKSFKSKHNNLVRLFSSQLRSKTNFGILILLATSMRDMVLPFSLIYLIKYPTIQILISLIFFLSMLTIILLTWPFRSKYENLIEIYNICTFVLILMIFLVLYYARDKISIIVVNTYLGYPIVGLLVILTLINLMYLVFSGFVAIKRILCTKEIKVERELRKNKSQNKRREHAITIQSMKFERKGLQNSKYINFQRLRNQKSIQENMSFLRHRRFSKKIKNTAKRPEFQHKFD